MLFPKRCWVLADYSMFGTWHEPPIVVRVFRSRWRWLAELKAWWFAHSHVRANPHGKAIVLRRPPPPIGDARWLE
jgi:hypothetical protein